MLLRHVELNGDKAHRSLDNIKAIGVDEPGSIKLAINT